MYAAWLSIILVFTMFLQQHYSIVANLKLFIHNFPLFTERYNTIHEQFVKIFCCCRARGKCCISSAVASSFFFNHCCDFQFTAANTVPFTIGNEKQRNPNANEFMRCRKNLFLWLVALFQFRTSIHDNFHWWFSSANFHSFTEFGNNFFFRRFSSARVCIYTRDGQHLSLDRFFFCCNHFVKQTNGFAQTFVSNDILFTLNPDAGFF